MKFRRKNSILLILFSIENNSHDLYTFVLIGCPPPLNESLKHRNYYTRRENTLSIYLVLSWVTALLQKTALLHFRSWWNLTYFFSYKQFQISMHNFFVTYKLTVSRVDSDSVKEEWCQKMNVNLLGSCKMNEDNFGRVATEPCWHWHTTLLYCATYPRVHI